MQINGTFYTVSVERVGTERFRVSLDGVSFEAEGTSNGEITTWLLRSESERIQAQSKNLANDRVDVWLACMPFPASVQALGMDGYAAVPEVSRKTVLGGQIRALMPGRITSILVREGEVVREGASLLILEAMKMQNEITTPIGGTIKKLLVREGETVKKDSSLVLIE